VGAVLNAGRLSPSAGNLQDRSFIVVKEPKTKETIAKACGNQTWMQSAPVLVVVVAENRKLSKFFGARGEKMYALQDTSFAVENMLLAATDLGLGASLVVGFDDDKVSDVLKIEPPAQPHAILTLGYPLEHAKPSSKYPLEKFVFFEQHGAKIESTESAFGNLKGIQEKVMAKTSEKTEEVKQTGIGLFAKIKAFFSRKKTEEQMEDHFMEESKPSVTELKSETKEEIPRQLKQTRL
jgi:hypothetical protein